VASFPCHLCVLRALCGSQRISHKEHKGHKEDAPQRRPDSPDFKLKPLRRDAFFLSVPAAVAPGPLLSNLRVSLSGSTFDQRWKIGG
jgi:hypothetical protein